MAVVNVTSVGVRKNPTTLFDGFELDVVFECLENLEDDLEWKLIYVGSAEDKSQDQELDCVVMGPIHRGALKFTFTTDGPDFSKIDPDDIHGFTILLLTGSYRDEEFIRIGWYVHNVYIDQELQDEPPEVPMLEKMQRLILTEAPRVTRFKISWDNPKQLSLQPDSSYSITSSSSNAVDEATRHNDSNDDSSLHQHSTNSQDTSFQNSHQTMLFGESNNLTKFNGTFGMQTNQFSSSGIPGGNVMGFPGRSHYFANQQQNNAAQNCHDTYNYQKCSENFISNPMHMNYGPQYSNCNGDGNSVSFAADVEMS